MSAAKTGKIKSAAKAAGFAAYAARVNARRENGEEAAPATGDWTAVIAAAKAAVVEEATDADALRKHALGGLPAVRESVAAAPIVGGSPAGGGGKKGPSFDATYEEIIKNMK